MALQLESSPWFQPGVLRLCAKPVRKSGGGLQNCANTDLAARWTAPGPIASAPSSLAVTTSRNSGRRCGAIGAASVCRRSCSSAGSKIAPRASPAKVDLANDNSNFICDKNAQPGMVRGMPGFWGVVRSMPKKERFAASQLELRAMKLSCPWSRRSGPHNRCLIPIFSCTSLSSGGRSAPVSACSAWSR